MQHNAHKSIIGEYINAYRGSGIVVVEVVDERGCNIIDLAPFLAVINDVSFYNIKDIMIECLNIDDLIGTRQIVLCKKIGVVFFKLVIKLYLTTGKTCFYRC